MNTNVNNKYDFLENEALNEQILFSLFDLFLDDTKLSPFRLYH